MGDVADILGGARRSQISEGEALLKDGGFKTGGGGGAGANKAKRKPAGMSREVFNLIGKEGMAPAVVSKKEVGLKDKREGMARTRWVFTTFRNSARKDQEKLDKLQQGQGGVGEEEAKEGGANGATAAAAGQVFFHWVKAATDYPDYPFARFNVQTPPVEFTDEEYKAFLAEGDAAAAAAMAEATARGAAGIVAWGIEETKVLLELCSRFDLRWPVIHDRFPEAIADAAAAAKKGEKEGGQEGGAASKANEATKSPSPQRSIEDLQARYYSVRKTLRLARQAAAAAAAAQGGVAPPQVMFQPGLDEDGDTFDHTYEKTRRAQLTQLFRRSKEEELEVLRRRWFKSRRSCHEWWTLTPPLPPRTLLPSLPISHRNSASAKSSRPSTPPSSACENTPTSLSFETPSKPRPPLPPTPILSNQGSTGPSPWSTKNTFLKRVPSPSQATLTFKVLVCRCHSPLPGYRRGCFKK